MKWFYEQPFVWVGANALLVYLGAATDLLDVLLGSIYYGETKNNVTDAFFSILCSEDESKCERGIFKGHDEKVCENS